SSRTLAMTSRAGGEKELGLAAQATSLGRSGRPRLVSVYFTGRTCEPRVGLVAPAVAAAGASAAALAAAPTAPGPRPVLAGPGLVDGQGAALELLAVHRLDRRVTALAHLDEAEAARTAGLPVHHDLGPADRAVLRERVAEVIGGRGE